MTRNPPWQRDELILALDLYFRHKPTSISKTHPEVVKLSEILDALPIHPDRPDRGRSRNPNGVYMKLCNFLALDPTYHGKGLERGGKAEQAVWNEFAGDRERLRNLADAIKAGYRVGSPGGQSAPEPDEEDFPEGRIVYRMHRARERNAKLVEAAKARFLKRYGRLHCMACGFDFGFSYGQWGEGYIECHHTLPLSSLASEKRARPQDLALLCSNCHRMVHRRRPWLGMKELSSLVGDPKRPARPL